MFGTVIMASEGELVGFVAAFARTGEIGPIRCGLSLHQLENALRGLRMIGPGEAVPTENVKFGSVEIYISRGVVVMLGLDSMGNLSFNLPESLRQGGSRHEYVRHQEVIDALARHSVRWSEDPDLTFDDQVAIKTTSGVSLVFTDRSPGWATNVSHRLLLHSMYRSAPM